MSNPSSPQNAEMLTEYQMKEQVLNIVYYAFGPSDSTDPEKPYHFCDGAGDGARSRIFTIILVSVWMIFF